MLKGLFFISFVVHNEFSYCLCRSSMDGNLMEHNGQCAMKVPSQLSTQIQRKVFEEQT